MSASGHFFLCGGFVTSFVGLSAAAQTLQFHFLDSAEVIRDGPSTSFSINNGSIAVERVGSVDSRALLEFFPVGFGVPADAVLVGATLDIETQFNSGDPVLNFHGYTGDGMIDVFAGDQNIPFNTSVDLAGRYEVPVGLTQGTVPLDIGPIFAALEAGGDPGLWVAQANPESSATLSGRGDANFPDLVLTYLEPSAGNRWVAGSGNWTGNGNWSGGVPTATADAFVQPAVAATVQAPNAFTDVGSLTLGGGSGGVTFVTQPNQQFNVAGQTTLFPNATLRLSERAYVTGGLHLHPGATLDWATDGVLSVNDGFLSPGDADFTIDGAGAPLMILSGDGKLYQNFPQRLVVGAAQNGVLLVGLGGEARVRNTSIGEQPTGVGTLDVQNGDTLFFSSVVEVGPQGRGTVKVRNGGVFEGALVSVGSDRVNNFNPDTLSRFQVGPGGTADILFGLNATGRAQVDIEAVTGQDAAVLNSVAVSVYGDASSVPEFRVAGVNATATLSDRLNLGLGIATQPEGTGRVVVEDGGTLETPLLVASLGLNGNTTGDTEVVVRGNGSRLSVATDLFAGYFGGSADIQLLDGGTFNVGGFTLLGAAGPDASAELTLDGNGTWNQLGSDLFVGGFRDPGSGDLFDGGTAAVYLLNGTLNSNAPVTIFAGGTVHLSGGGWLNAVSVHNDRGGAFHFTGGILETGLFVGDLAQVGGDFQAVGAASVDGDYALNGGRTTFQLLDPQAAEPNESLTVTGDVSLGGELDLSVSPEYLPQPYTDSFTLIGANSVSGVFDTVSNLGLIDGFAIAITYLPTEVVFTVALAGDANLNQLVEQGDLNAVLSNWGKTAAADGVSWVTGDLNGNGLVEQGDLNAVLNNWGDTAAPDFTGFAVPEPGAAVLGGVFALGVRRRRRRR